MKKIVRLTEDQLTQIIEKTILKEENIQTSSNDCIKFVLWLLEKRPEFYKIWKTPNVDGMGPIERYYKLYKSQTL